MIYLFIDVYCILYIDQNAKWVDIRFIDESINDKSIYSLILPSIN